MAGLFWLRCHSDWTVVRLIAEKNIQIVKLIKDELSKIYKAVVVVALVVVVDLVVVVLVVVGPLVVVAGNCGSVLNCWDFNQFSNLESICSSTTLE
jgi:hypothetical protein